MLLNAYRFYVLLLLGLVLASSVQMSFEQAVQAGSLEHIRDSFIVLLNQNQLPNPRILGDVEDMEIIEAVLSCFDPATDSAHSLFISKIVRHQLESRQKKKSGCQMIIERCLEKLGRQQMDQEDTFWKRIQILVLEGDVEMVKIFHRAGYIVHDTEFLRLQSIAANRQEMVEFFLESGRSLIDFESTIVRMIEHREIDPKTFEYYVSNGLQPAFKHCTLNMLEISMVKGNVVMAYYFYKKGMSLEGFTNIRMSLYNAKLRPEHLVKFIVFKEKMFWIHQALQDESSTLFDFPKEIMDGLIANMLLGCGSMDDTEAAWSKALQLPEVRPDLVKSIFGRMDPEHLCS